AAHFRKKGSTACKGESEEFLAMCEEWG
ncbi:DNA replication protein DnaD, partial [Bacillus paranthracis]|nr:DNA replication protein DnaD [Bacillus paranthracis]